VTLAALTALGRRPVWVRWGLLGAGLLTALALPWLLYPPVATDILCWGLFAVAVDLLLGYTGLLSFGHAAFWGTATYTTGVIAIHTGVPFYLAVLGGALMAALLALPIGYLSVCRSGIYFAMVTLAFAQMLYFAANQWRSVTGGENGLQDIPRSLAGVDLSNAFFYYYAALPLILLGLAFAWRTVHSPFGRIIVAIRENTPRVRALGYPADRYKLVVFVVSASLSGLAGGVHAVNHGFASLQEVYWTTSGTVVVMTILGGIGTLWGSLVGAALIVRLQDWLSTSGFDEVGLATGAVFILVVLLFRRGMWGTVAHALRRRTARPAAEETGPVGDVNPDSDREQELRSIG